MYKAVHKLIKGEHNMSYVIYNKETTVILQARARSVGCYMDSYKTESAAKAALTRLDNKDLLGKSCVQVKTTLPNGMDGFESVCTAYVKEDFAIAEISDFRNNIEKTMISRNAMTGEAFEESV